MASATSGSGRARLGQDFDIRRFHDAVLAHGSMPLGVLEEHLNRTLHRSASR